MTSRCVVVGREVLGKLRALPKARFGVRAELRHVLHALHSQAYDAFGTLEMSWYPVKHELTYRFNLPSGHIMAGIQAMHAEVTQLYLLDAWLPEGPDDDGPAGGMAATSGFSVSNFFELFAPLFANGCFELVADRRSESCRIEFPLPYAVRSGGKQVNENALAFYDCFELVAYRSVESYGMSLSIH